MKLKQASLALLLTGMLMSGVASAHPGPIEDRFSLVPAECQLTFVLGHGIIKVCEFSPEFDPETESFATPTFETFLLSGPRSIRALQAEIDLPEEAVEELLALVHPGKKKRLMLFKGEFGHHESADVQEEIDSGFAFPHLVLLDEEEYDVLSEHEWSNAVESFIGIEDPSSQYAKSFKLYLDKKADYHFVKELVALKTFLVAVGEEPVSANATCDNIFAPISKVHLWERCVLAGPGGSNSNIPAVFKTLLISNQQGAEAVAEELGLGSEWVAEIAEDLQFNRRTRLLFFEVTKDSDTLDNHLPNFRIVKLNKAQYDTLASYESLLERRFIEDSPVNIFKSFQLNLDVPRLHKPIKLVRKPFLLRTLLLEVGNIS